MQQQIDSSAVALCWYEFECGARPCRTVAFAKARVLRMPNAMSQLCTASPPGRLVLIRASVPIACVTSRATTAHLSRLSAHDSCRFRPGSGRPGLREIASILDAQLNCLAYQAVSQCTAAKLFSRVYVRANSPKIAMSSTKCALHMQRVKAPGLCCHEPSADRVGRLVPKILYTTLIPAQHRQQVTPLHSHNWHTKSSCKRAAQHPESTAPDSSDVHPIHANRRSQCKH